MTYIVSVNPQVVASTRLTAATGDREGCGMLLPEDKGLVGGVRASETHTLKTWRCNDGGFCTTSGSIAGLGLGVGAPAEPAVGVSSPLFLSHPRQR